MNNNFLLENTRNCLNLFTVTGSFLSPLWKLCQVQVLLRHFVELQSCFSVLPHSPCSTARMSCSFILTEVLHLSSLPISMCVDSPPTHHYQTLPEFTALSSHKAVSVAFFTCPTTTFSVPSGHSASNYKVRGPWKACKLNAQAGLLGEVAVACALWSVLRLLLGFRCSRVSTCPYDGHVPKHYSQ